MLRAFSILASLTLLLAPSSLAALVSAAPAPLPSATSENASTASFEGGSESRIGLLCHNDPVNKSDPTGNSPVKLLKFVIKGVKFLKKGEHAVKATSATDAVRLAKEGEKFVMTPSKDVAKEAARKLGDGKPPIHEIDKKTGSPHYHDADRSGSHFLYNAAAAVTLEHYAEGHGTLIETGATIGDFFNPLSTPKDLYDIGNELFGK